MLYYFEIFETLNRELGSYDVAMQKVRVRKRNKRNDVIMSPTEVKEIDDSSAQFIKSVIEGLDLGSGEFILAVCWVTEHARHYHRLFPSVLGLSSGSNLLWTMCFQSVSRLMRRICSSMLTLLEKARKERNCFCQLNL